MDDSLLARLGLALAIGLIVGLERGWRLREEASGTRVAGIRTYALTGLLGGTSAAVGEAFAAPALFATGFVVFGLIFAVFQFREGERRNSSSVTGTIAGLAVFALAGLAVAGDAIAAGAGGVALACLLAMREVLHNLLQRLTWLELRSALLLLAMTMIVLPLLPNRTIDPWGGINPWEIWFFTVLTAAISFAGYVAVKLLGPSRGILVSALIGAIVSSTAVTMAFGRRAKSGAERWQPLAGGAALAAMVSVTRVVVIIAVVKPELAVAIAVPAAAGALTFGAVGALMLRRAGLGAAAEAKLANPFDLGPLLLFAAAFAVIAGASAAASSTLGSESVILTAGLTGIFNVDIAALTTGRLAGGVVPMETAARAALLALALNAGGRLSAAAVAGPIRYTAFLVAATAAAIAVGATAAWLMGVFG